MDNKEGFLEKFKSKEFIFKVIPFIISFLGILLMLIVFAIDIKVGKFTYASIWDAADVTTNNNGAHIGCMVLIILFVANILAFIAGIILAVRKKASGLYITAFSSLCFKLATLILNNTLDLASTGGMAFIKIFLLILGLISDIGSLVAIFYAQKKLILFEGNKDYKEVSPADYKILLITAIISLVGFISVFLVPLYTYIDGTTEYTFMLLEGLSGNVEIGVQIAFISVFLAFIAMLLYFIHSLAFFRNYKNEFVKRTHSLVYSSFALTLVYFLIGYFLCMFKAIEGVEASTISFIPFIIMIAVLIFYSIIKGKFNFISEIELKKQRKNKLEPLIYLSILTLLCLVTLFINVIEIHFRYLGKAVEESYTGLFLLKNNAENGAYQMVTFVVFSIIITSAVLLIVSVAAFLSRNKAYYKITTAAILADVIMLFFLGMLGIYYSIAQKINEENILTILANNGYPGLNFDYVSEVKSQAIFLFLISLGILIIAIARKQLGHPINDPLEVSISNTEEITKKSSSSAAAAFNSNSSLPSDFDACPVFTELDEKKELYDEEYNNKLNSLYDNPTLPALVNFIVEYAKESRLHLSYSHEDIATFVAGLGASRLSILQGMSGTGKTSLPKIFCEAILGNCEVIEVESSWRDKNELLGYYNEFSKTYSPKKFTQRLYKAKLNPEVVTFIVLDEMNLSRIEYYFSDFLSLMEHEEHNREIKLLNIKLNRIENNQKYDYLALSEGHTIKIPTNVWFIGTANRDESTFEISDKVYDRAQTMNFNKRAPKIRSYTAPIPQKFLKYSDLSKLLKDAINNGSFEAEDNSIIKAVEKILQPFNISFGYRVLKQIEEFVKIYCACFKDSNAVLNEAIEKIILSKVVAKLEFKNVENKDKLVSEFKKLGLQACSEFVSKLNED